MQIIIHYSCYISNDIIDITHYSLIIIDFLLILWVTNIYF